MRNPRQQRLDVLRVGRQCTGMLPMALLLAVSVPQRLVVGMLSVKKLPDSLILGTFVLV